MNLSSLYLRFFFFNTGFLLVLELCSVPLAKHHMSLPLLSWEPHQYNHSQLCEFLLTHVVEWSNWHHYHRAAERTSFARESALCGSLHCSSGLALLRLACSNSLQRMEIALVDECKTSRGILSVSGFFYANYVSSSSFCKVTVNSLKLHFLMKS